MNTHTINNGPYCLFYGVIQANSNSSLPAAFGIIVSVKRPLSLLNHRRSYNTRLLFFLHEDEQVYGEVNQSQQESSQRRINVLLK